MNPSPVVSQEKTLRNTKDGSMVVVRQIGNKPYQAIYFSGRMPENLN